MSSTANITWWLGVAWGSMVAMPIARRARRATTAERVGALTTQDLSRASRAHRRWWCAVGRDVRTDLVGLRVLTSSWARRRERRDAAMLRRELPVAVDLLGVAVGAGCTPYLALGVAARWVPGPLARAFDGVLRSCSLGLDFAAALDAMARASPVLRPIADALLATDRLGVAVGPVLARLADEDRTALRRAAEAHARRIPVRLLFPLVFLVLPAFVLLTVVPGLAAGLGRL